MVAEMVAEVHSNVDGEMLHAGLKGRRSFAGKVKFLEEQATHHRGGDGRGGRGGGRAEAREKSAGGRVGFPVIINHAGSGRGGAAGEPVARGGVRCVDAGCQGYGGKGQRQRDSRSRWWRPRGRGGQAQQWSSPPRPRAPGRSPRVSGIDHPKTKKKRRLDYFKSSTRECVPPVPKRPAPK